ncbi:unnamed protein product [Protopolystoma xenopodis]|uniref:Uncharacterized protein n=1 Tax=Protopolystoma xenopodis TaxID=117903 RepID=A0A3S4ZX20_9PLAT|nr:unnamed protein product [Protopolystoma xenopodis]
MSEAPTAPSRGLAGTAVGGRRTGFIRLLPVRQRGLSQAYSDLSERVRWLHAAERTIRLWRAEQAAGQQAGGDSGRRSQNAGMCVGGQAPRQAHRPEVTQPNAHTHSHRIRQANSPHQQQ